MYIERLNKDSATYQAAIEKICYWHNLTPKLWRPDYKVNQKYLDETKQRIEDASSDNQFISVLYHESHEPQGFIWAQRQDSEKNRVMILSLFVEKSYRNLGYAIKLKEALEAWCLVSGIQYIDTTTHYTNKKMLKLNEKLGYEPGMVKLTKKLL